MCTGTVCFDCFQIGSSSYQSLYIIDHRKVPVFYKFKVTGSIQACMAKNRNNSLVETICYFVLAKKCSMFSSISISSVPALQCTFLQLFFYFFGNQRILIRINPSCTSTQILKSSGLEPEPEPQLLASADRNRNAFRFRILFRSRIRIRILARIQHKMEYKNQKSQKIKTQMTTFWETMLLFNIKKARFCTIFF